MRECKTEKGVGGWVQQEIYKRECERERERETERQRDRERDRERGRVREIDFKRPYNNRRRAT